MPVLVLLKQREVSLSPPSNLQESDNNLVEICTKTIDQNQGGNKSLLMTEVVMMVDCSLVHFGSC